MVVYFSCTRKMCLCFECSVTRSPVIVQNLMNMESIYYRNIPRKSGVDVRYKSTWSKTIPKMFDPDSGSVKQIVTTKKYTSLITKIRLSKACREMNKIINHSIQSTIYRIGQFWRIFCYWHSYFSLFTDSANQKFYLNCIKSTKVHYIKLMYNNQTKYKI